MSESSEAPRYRERLLPGPGLFLALFLIAPAIALVMIPLSVEWAIPAGLIAYALLALLLFAMSPTLDVSNGMFIAGRATIETKYLGEITMLGREAMRSALGPGLDARAYTLVRGWIHRGVVIEIVDESDTTPYWIITTRHPERLARALKSSELPGALGAHRAEI